MVRRDKFPYTNNIVLSQLYPTSQMLAECISFGCSPNKAVVGANAFAHESGIHQHGMMANPLTYEIMTPESVGAGHTKLVLGKHSGRRALADRLEKLGHPLDRTSSTKSTPASLNSRTARNPSTTRTCSASCNPAKSIPVATV
jgi:2-isopropylmalate synthase